MTALALIRDPRPRSSRGRRGAGEGQGSVPGGGSADSAFHGGAARGGSAGASGGGVRGEPTLGDVIARAWEGLARHATARCPVCGGALERRPTGAGDRFTGACRDCGTTLR